MVKLAANGFVVHSRNMLFRHSKAFTLVEVLVAIMILLILIAVTVPSFLLPEASGKDNQTWQTLTIVRSDLRSQWLNVNGAEPGYVNSSQAVIDDLHNQSPDIKVVEGTSNANKQQVGFDYNSVDSITACMQSRSNSFFCFQTQEGSAVTELARLSFGSVAYAEDINDGHVRLSAGKTIDDALAALSPQTEGQTVAAKGPGGSGIPRWSTIAS